MTPRDLELAFACSWWWPREPTWSYTPISLRQGLLDSGVTLRDVEAQPPVPLKAAIVAALMASGSLPWKYSRLYQRVESRRVQRRVEQLQPDAVLELADVVVPTAAPTFAYQDMNFEVAAAYQPQLGPNMVSTFPTRPSMLRRLADQQNEALARMDGVFVMGRWFGEFLVRKGIVTRDRIHVAGGGISRVYRNPPQREVGARDERTRVLFVGGDFCRKGGDLVIEAVRRLNRAGDRALSLTIAGPAKGEAPAALPDWVDYRGPASRAEVRELFASHDLFAMPSRFEAFGVVFLEARAMGLPCIGRDAFAMPELIEPGVGGQVWKSDDVDDLAELIANALDDDSLHERCALDAADFAASHGWDRVAQRIMGHIGSS